MNELQRFKAVVNFEKPDYYPIFGFSGAPGFAGGCYEVTRQKLIAEGMPSYVGGGYTNDTFTNSELINLKSWHQYWGVTGPDYIDFFPADPTGNEIAYEVRVEGDFEILEYETGEITRQVIDNDVTYSMPEFIRYPVRDRASWEFYKEKTRPGKRWSDEKIKAACAKYKNRTRPLGIGVGNTWGMIRDLMGTVAASTLLYDDMPLAKDMIDHIRWRNREYIFPLIEELRPEIMQGGEDLCYKSGMLISPEHFNELCGPLYAECAEVARACGVDLFTLDNDGNCMQFVDVVEKLGVNGMFPFEVKAGNDLFELRKKHPKFILAGWLEKEIVNEGNGHMIRDEIMQKVPPLLEKGGYFPNGDHGIQPFITFENLCKLMTLLHEVTGNPEGDFPRIYP